MNHHMKSACPPCGGIKDNRAKLCRQCFIRLKPKQRRVVKKGWYLNLGYIMLYLPWHPHSTYDGYIREHRAVMEEYLCRTLKREEHIHHKNGIKTDNRLSNLILTSNAEHPRFHPSTLKGKTWGVIEGRRVWLCR